MDPHEGFILEYRGIRGCPGFRVESVVDAKPAFNFTTGVKQRTTRRRRKRRKHSQDDDDDDDDDEPVSLRGTWRSWETKRTFLVSSESPREEAQ